LAEEKAGQPKDATETASGEPKGLRGVWDGDYFQKGMEKLDEDDLGSAKKSDEDCPECVKERLAKEAAEAKAKGAQEKKPPYKIIKVQGRDYAVESEEEYNKLASMGVDYTKKTQALAEKRRAIDEDLPGMQGAIERFNALAERLEKGVAVGARAEASAKAAPAADVPLEEEFGYDPEMVDPHVPKLAAALRASNKKLDMLEQSNKLFFLDKIVNTIQGTITQAVKEYPLEDIKDEAGKSITWPQFVGTLKNLIEDPANNNRSIPEMTVEAVKAIHLSQRTLRERSAEEAKSDAVSDDIPLDELKAKHPKLFERISDQAIAEHAAKAGELPPTPKSRGTEATAKTVEKRYVEGRKFRETMDDAFKDPEVLAGFGIHQQ
jgi:hypothetical protein